jgi:hypothetical protein
MSLEVENVERLSFHQREDEVWHVAPSLVLRCHQHLQWLPKKEALLRNYTPTLVRAKGSVSDRLNYLYTHCFGAQLRCICRFEIHK